MVSILMISLPLVDEVAFRVLGGHLDISQGSFAVHLLEVSELFIAFRFVRHIEFH